MKVTIALDPQLGEMLKQVLAAAVLVAHDVGAPPQGESLFSFALAGNPLFGDVAVTVSAAPELVDWTGRIVSRLGGKYNPPPAVQPSANNA